MTNNTTIFGTIVKQPEFSHTLVDSRGSEDDIYIMYVSVRRYNNSKSSDIIPVMISFEKLRMFMPKNGDLVEVSGPVQNRIYEGSSTTKTLMYIKADKLVQAERLPLISEKSCKTIITDATVANLIYRVTPSRKKLVELQLKVPRLSDPSYVDYINCVAWGKAAIFLANMVPVGSVVNIEGFVSSRDYNKTLENGTEETRRTYEISIVKLDVQNLDEDSKLVKAE